ncbi:MAG: hypothetical protein KJ072_08025 [Verrucomicrobia bacterium]|nr:hypothetical protein [Verrucomicrobiota bacterium]
MGRGLFAGLVFCASVLGCRGATFNVSNVGNGGIGSLRQAILNANASPEADRIEFGIRTVAGTPPRIQLTSPLPSITRSVDIDGTTQASGRVEIDGLAAGSNADGIRIEATGCEIRGLVINRFSGDGIEVIEPARDTWIRQCFIGTSADGADALGNGGHGVHIIDSASNSVGANRGRGTLIPGPYRNVISGNGGSGVFITGSGARRNDVIGNYVGVSGNGGAVLGNAGNGVSITGGALENFVGAVITGSHNVISGNAGHGVEILSVGTEELRTLASTDVPKTVPVWAETIGEVRSSLNVTDWYCVLDLDVQLHLTHDPIEDEALTLIGPDGYAYTFEGGFGPVSGNEYLNTIWDDEGGFIGYAAAPYSNRYSGVGRQFERYDLRSPRGEWLLAVRNIDRTSTATLHSWALLITTIPGNMVSGNYIGVDAAGSNDLGNGRNGVHLNGSPGNRVGGTSALERNVIAGNANDGVQVTGAMAVGNVVSGNYIGLTADGQTSLGNSFSGVAIFGGARNMIGGASADAGNVISGNGFTGVILSGAAQRNQILGNAIGVGADGTTARGNGADGVRIEAASNDNRVGGLQANASFVLVAYGGNVIANNSGAGVLVTGYGGNSVRNSIQANSIYGNGGLGIDLSRDLPADGVTLRSGLGGLRSGPNHSQAMPELGPYFAGLHAEGYVRSGDVHEIGKYVTVDFFTSSAVDGSGYGEGRSFLGSLPLNQAEEGVFDFKSNTHEAYLLFTPTAGDYLTATATDPDGNTSEFSRAELIQANAGIVITWRSSAASPLYGGAVELDKPFTYTTRVVNYGPDLATNVWVTNYLPNSVELISYAATRGECTNAGNEVTCAISELAVGTNTAVELMMEVVPRVEGFITNNATVSSPNLAGGTRATSPFQYNWVGRPVPSEYSVIGTNLVITGSTNQMPGNVQYTTNLAPPVVWQYIEGVPREIVSSNWLYRIPLSGTNRFFRTIIRTRHP